MKNTEKEIAVTVINQKPVEKINTLVTTSEGLITNSQLQDVFNSDLFEGEGVNMNTNPMRKEDWLAVKGVEIKVVFGGMTAMGYDDETGKEYKNVLYVSNYANGKDVVNYKSGLSKLVNAFEDGGKGLYVVTCLGEKKREGKKGTFVDFDIVQKNKIV